MKTLLAAILAMSSLTAMAESVTTTRVLKDETTVIALKLTPDTVFCTDRGYGNIQLKVSVPDLDWLAHFDHRVFGEGLPCIAGGRCDETRNPGAILNSTNAYDVVPVRVILSEILEIDADAKTCTRSLQETVKAHIRGVDFSHDRYDEAPALVEFERCNLVKNL